MKKFYATIEIGHGRGILTMTDEHRQFVCGGRVETRSGQREDIYEVAYTQAAATATLKGGRLETFKEMPWGDTSGEILAPNGKPN